VVNCVNRHPAPMAPHWLNTSANRLVYEELEAGGLPLKRDLEKLLAGEELRYPINESIVFADIGANRENIWSFLYYSGYLKATDPGFDDLGRLTYALSIPNREVGIAYRQFVDRAYGRAQEGGIQDFLDWFIGDRPAGDLERIMQPLVLELVSSHDAARQPEAVFHAFALGLLANLRTVYEIRSNAESGYGRADILMRPKTDRYPLGFVIEFKSIDRSADADSALSAALAQIEDKEYMARLREAGVPDEHIRRVAVVLQGRRLAVAKTGDV
jgi:hypothetical protein